MRVYFPVVGPRRNNASEDVLAYVEVTPAKYTSLGSSVPISQPAYVWQAKKAAIGDAPVKIFIYDNLHTRIDGNSYQMAVACACLGIPVAGSITGSYAGGRGMSITCGPIGEVQEKVRNLAVQDPMFVPWANVGEVPMGYGPRIRPYVTIADVARQSGL